MYRNLTFKEFLHEAVYQSTQYSDWVSDVINKHVNSDSLPGTIATKDFSPEHTNRVLKDMTNKYGPVQFHQPAEGYRTNGIYAHGWRVKIKGRLFDIQVNIKSNNIKIGHY